MKLLLIEDDSELIESVSLALNLGWPGAEVITARLGKRGIELVEEEKPDIVLLDLGLPDINGFDVLKKIRTFSEVPIMIETVHKSENDIVKGLSLGADEYIFKPFGQMELLARIKSVLKKNAYDVSQGTVSCGNLHLNIPGSYLNQGHQSIKLTPTEVRIMQILMENAGKTQTFSDLAEIVWGIDYPGSAKSLRVYIHRLRNKIESISNTVKITSRPSIGFVLEICI